MLYCSSIGTYYDVIYSFLHFKVTILEVLQSVDCRYLPLVLVYFKHFLCYVFIYGVFYRCLISLGYLPFLQVLNIRFFVFWKALVVVHNMDNMLYALCCFLEFRWIIDNISVQFEPLWLLWVFLFSLSPEIAFKGK